MPAPFTTAAIGFAAVLLPLSEVAAAIVAGIGFANQVAVTAATMATEGTPDGDR